MTTPNNDTPIPRVIGSITVRDSQIEAVLGLRREIAAGKRVVMLQASCGFGKTICASLLLHLVTAKGRKGLFLAPMRELIVQASNKLTTAGVRHGIIMAGHGYTTADVQVASKDTLLARGVRNNKITLPPADVVIVDEAHLSTSKGWCDLLRRYPRAAIIGLTATPVAAKGSSLQPPYQSMVLTPPTSKLIADGLLVPTVCYGPSKPNLRPNKGEKWRGKDGDYLTAFLERRMNRPQLVGDIVGHWFRLARGRPTIAVGASIDHATSVAAAFANAGVRCGVVHGRLHDDETVRVLKDFRDGNLDVLSSCDMLTYGVDFPHASCLVLARPTRSFRLYRQIVGRIGRTYPGKTNAVLLDHAGCVHEHGFPDDDVDWKLEAGQKIQDKVKERLKGEGRVFTCKNCFAEFSGTNVCPQCETVLERKAKELPLSKKDGVLVRLQQAAQAPEATREQLIRCWHSALAAAANKGLSFSSAVHIFKGLTQRLPWNVQGMPNMPPSTDFGKRVCDVFPQYVSARRTQ